MKIALLFFTFLLFFSCQNTSKPSTPTDSKPHTSAALDPEPQPIDMVVYIDNLRLRDGAGEDSKEIARLPQHMKVTYYGEMSDFTTKIKLRGFLFDDPWLQVTAESGMKGWVYAAGVRPATNNTSEAIAILDKIRLENLLGKNLDRHVLDYQNNFPKITSSVDFANQFILGNELQEKVNAILTDKIDVNDPQILPDMEWLERAMPGYSVSLVAEGTKFYLFKNFKSMMPIAQKTEGTEDDDFINLNFIVHSADSIEHFFPSWFLQTWDYGGHSLLGQNVHFKILNKMNDLLEKSQLFEPSIKDLKTQLLKDIIEPHVTFWEPQKKILAELDKIIAANFSFLSKEDLIALKTRRKMFENLSANKIQVNQRGG